jgi:threonine/homoserine/homoserine lactone efflux protein
VAYLLYLGLQLWRAPQTSAEADEPVRHPAGRVVLRAFLVNVFHPKGLAFYVAFLPQFIDPARPVLPQMATLMAVFSAIAFSVLLGYALTATRFRSVLSSAHARRAFNRTGASCLFGASGYTATLQQGG